MSCYRCADKFGLFKKEVVVLKSIPSKILDEFYLDLFR